MKKGRFLWSAHRITEKPKAGKARNIKEKQLKNSRNMDFDQVYRAFFRDVLFYVWGLCGDRVLAEEIAQETFFKALKSIDRFDGQGDIRPWLFAISKNTYYDHCRKQKKTEPLEEEKEQAAEPLFLEKMTDAETAFAVHAFLHEMDEPYKEVFTLRVFGELPFEKIGQLFGKSTSWARVTYYRAKQKVTAYMEEMEHE